MYVLKVNDMSCNHCVSMVTKSVLAVDANAKVEVDLARKTVKVDSAEDLEEIASAIDEAGYPVVASTTV